MLNVAVRASFLALVGVSAAACMSPVMRFGGGKSAREAQGHTMAANTPGAISTEGDEARDAPTAKVRVYADDAYRAQNLHWREVFDDELEAANAVLAPVFGVKLVAHYREWEHHAPANQLSEDLAALGRFPISRRRSARSRTSRADVTRPPRSCCTSSATCSAPSTTPKRRP